MQHMSKSIRVTEETHATLESLKGDDETFDEVIATLLKARRETIRDGAGLWEGTDAPHNARAARKSLKQDVGPQ